mmetsp:Transcript_106024/g.253039  ORF Transcript_106024/g.253039 Transcript_106024/m.253039 type:complete len:250 (-) Transcript_106024:1846-2595(-)
MSVDYVGLIGPAQILSSEIGLGPLRTLFPRGPKRRKACLRGFLHATICLEAVRVLHHHRNARRTGLPRRRSVDQNGAEKCLQVLEHLLVPCADVQILQPKAALSEARIRGEKDLDAGSLPSKSIQVEQVGCEAFPMTAPCPPILRCAVLPVGRWVLCINCLSGKGRDCLHSLEIIVASLRSQHHHLVARAVLLSFNPGCLVDVQPHLHAIPALHLAARCGGLHEGPDLLLHVPPRSQVHGEVAGLWQLQ